MQKEIVKILKLFEEEHKKIIEIFLERFVDVGKKL